MLLESLRQQVLEANQEISRRGLAPHTFGNASGIDRSGAQPLVVIKPSGVDYATLTTADLVVTDLEGNIIEGHLRPSSDLDTHTLLYREFSEIGGIVHTHSEFATSWAQACRPIPCLGTTHADYFHGAVPIAEPLTAEEVSSGYVRNTGAIIVRRFRSEDLDPIAIPGVLVAGHAPFAWERPRPRASNMLTSLNTSRALPSIPSFSTPQSSPSPAMSANIITSASTVPRPLTVNADCFGNSAFLREERQQLAGSFLAE